MQKNTILIAALGYFIWQFAGCNPHSGSIDYYSWSHYAGTPDAARYSALNQIDTNNVHLLQIAWEYHSGDADTAGGTQIQCNPLIVDGLLYGATPTKNIAALDAASGALKWLFNPGEFIRDSTPTWAGTVRGLSYWSEKEEKRLFTTAGPYLFALDPDSGQPITSFGKQGKIDLRENLGLDNPYQYFISANTPGIVYKNLIIMGMRVSEDSDAAPGHIRAFDVRTGQLSWTFRTIPRPGEAGFETWEDQEAWKTAGGANCWAGMSLDEKRGIVFVPTGSATPDFYGGLRKGSNLYANCLIALDAGTGKRIWHFQTVHHDLWDKDLPANPNLVTIKKDGKTISAVAQITKSGFVFLFERVRGRPVYPIEEKQVPTITDLKDEVPWPTQPYPSKPAPFARQHFAQSDINTITTTAEEQMAITARLKQIKTAHMFTPPSKQGVMIFPGFDGGGEWGGAAYDPATAVLYVNSNEMPWIMEMVETPTILASPGQAVFLEHCATCHGMQKQGNTDGTIPPLTQLTEKYTPKTLVALITGGRRMMPAFPQLTHTEKEAVASFLLNDNIDEKPVTLVSPHVPYRMNGYNRFLTHSGHPAVSPPWGTLNAIDLNTGNYLWRVPLGEFEDLKAKGIPITGTENYGGPAVTAGGLVFIAATKDEKIRAFHKRTGKVLWEWRLPAGGYATPAIYSIDGRQYVAIACGGGKMGTKSGDSYIAFALPEHQ